MYMISSRGCGATLNVTDVIFHVRVDELCANDFPKSKLTALSRHGIRSRCGSLHVSLVDRGLAGATCEHFVLSGCYETLDLRMCLPIWTEVFLGRVGCGLQ
jgi:hypothetical protein